MGSTLQAIIFDLDGVITNTAQYHYLAWLTLAKELNIPFTCEFNEELKGISRWESLEKILALGGREQDFTEAEKVSLTDKKNQHYLSLIKKITPQDILPGIKPLIQEVKKQGLGLGLASASKNAFIVIEALGLENQFDVIVDAKEVKKGKPDPEIFLKAAQLLKVEPPGCIGVEDAVAGGEAIKRAGMFAVAIGSKKVFGQADLVYSSTEQLSFTEILTHYRKKLKY